MTKQITTRSSRGSNISTVASVVHINDKTTLSGGVEISISQLQPALRAAGWNTDWVAMRRSGKHLVIECEDGRLSWEGRMSDFSDSPLGMLTREHQPIYHVHSISDPVIIDLCLSQAPVIRTMHEPRIFCPGQGKFWRKDEMPCPIPMGVHCLVHAYTKQCCHRHPKRLLKAYANANYERNTACHRYFRLIANSNWTRDQAILANIPSEKISVVHYSTEITDECAADVPIDARIVFAGRLSKTKGVHHLLYAFHKVIESVPNAKLDILGAGIDAAEFVTLTTQLGLSESVTFHGWADRAMIDAVISHAAVVAFPSIYPEAFGISGIEAMIRGKPVVGYDVGGVSDWLQDGVTGTLVPAKDIERFAAALTDLLRNPEKSRIYGRNARAIALEKFSPERHLEKLVEIYEQALKTQSPGA